jgi:alkaline phosphatase D
MKNERNLNRRKFLEQSAQGVGSLVLSTILVGGCSEVVPKPVPAPEPRPVDPNTTGPFAHGVASFDPTDSQIILWTRVSPDNPALAQVALTYEIATDAAFGAVLKTETVNALAADDFTVSIDLSGLTSNTAYFYRFTVEGTTSRSVVGQTRTLPRAGERAEIKIASCSCANFQAGLFTVYEAIANSDADVVLHLGDYIYEYGVGQYGTNASTSSLGRGHQPTTEILSLDDYRTRFRQYRSDPQLQLAHQKKPFICVWDDHEVANDSWKDGAQNHQDNEGPYAARKANAQKAYHEYIGIRTTADARIYRSFTFGDILNLHMLDTRHVGRDRRLDYAPYVNAARELDASAFQRDWQDPQRTMLGSEQLAWLGQALSSSAATWQVLGQQVLMQKMYIPAELVLDIVQIQQEGASGMVNPETTARIQSKIFALNAIKKRVVANDPSVTPEERARVTNVLPYNLDAWDGYPVERETVYGLAKGKRLIALAGDTHNAWYGDLTATDRSVVGREVAVPAVTSPGFEGVLGSNAVAIAFFEDTLTLLIDDLKYANISRKGYTLLTLTTTQAVAEWRYVDSIVTQAANVTLTSTQLLPA